jgi:hypothetical protein
LFVFDDLHDAILEGVDLDPEAETVTLRISPIQFPGAPFSITIVANGWTRLECPHEQPWGLSGIWRVNEAHPPVAINDRTTGFTLEMQSGDTVMIHAREFVRNDLHVDTTAS